MGDTLLSCAEVEKDLGVHIDSELKFKQQAAAAVAKTTQMLAVIRRSFALLDERTHSILYTLSSTGATSPRIREPCVGSFQPDRPEEAGEGAEKGNSTADKASPSSL